MSKKPIISVIFVSYKDKDVLKRSIKSIYEFFQDVVFEIIVIDNSEERILEKKLKNRDNLSVVSSQKNLGFAV